ISIKFWGFSRVHWTEGLELGDKTTHYKSNEEYYANDFMLKGNGSTVEVLPLGDHIFNFSFVLPEHIPSSFESFVGQVRHQCKATLIIPIWPNKTCNKPYSINTLYDLNMDYIAKGPVSADASKTICCLCCTSGPISLALQINRSGFVPGEKLYFNAECSNQSNRCITSSKVEILQVATFTGRKFKNHMRKPGIRQRKQTKIVAMMEHGEIPKGESDTWNNEDLLIPPIPSSHLIFCDNITIQYFVEFSAVPSGPGIHLRLMAPILIGSIPLQQNFNLFEPSQTTHFVTGIQNHGDETEADPSSSYITGMPTTAQLAVGFTFPGLSQYPDMPPPSYAESMISAPMGAKCDIDEYNNSVFNPQYILYSLKNN
ncbi:unnamed protein product, partial [Meganyctiphanes norvegica]